MRFENRVALVTGGASGIGRAICKRLAQEGATVIVIDINQTGARRTAEDILNDNGTAHVRILDVTDSSGINDLVAEIYDLFGRIDILVNCAGIGDAAEVLECQDDLWHKVIDVNLNGVMYSTRAVSKLWVDRGSAGKIVNIASISSFIAEEGLAAYSASKAGVLLYSRVAALELAKYGININCVAPGIVPTPMTHYYTEDPVKSAESLAKIPLGRFTTPEEIAGVVAFLASDDSASIVGECIVCDGGFLLL